MAAIQSIHVHQLLRLRNIQVDFQGKGVTAIMGANGTGKTTLLQALACTYQKDRNMTLEQEDYSYDVFFKRSLENIWDGSSYDISFLDDGSVIYSCEGDNWNPRIQNRKYGYTKYISILECAPDQEKESEDNIGGFQTQNLGISESKKRTLIEKVSGSLKRSYSDVCLANKESGLSQFMQASVLDRTLGDITYPSHYMGAGEQKIIHIIREILKAPNGALVLIEELEISLHDSAIKSLIIFLLEQANQKSLQIIFTTHWLRIQEFEDNEDMRIVSLYVDPDTDVVTKRDGFDPQFIHNLNGDYEQMRQIKVWVEDGVALEIVKLVARSIGIMPFLDVKTFGSIQNAYTIAGAVSVMGENLDRTLIVTDGDSYTSEQEKRNQIGRSIDGNGDEATRWRAKALELIVDLAAPQQHQPEKVILDICEALTNQGNAPTWVENDLGWINQQHPVPQGKEAFLQLATHKNHGIDRITQQYLEFISDTELWDAYIAPLKDRLIEIAENLGIDLGLEEVAA